MKQVTAEEMLQIEREHWAIENNLHLNLEMIFREDESRARIENAAEILIYYESMRYRR